MSDNLIPQKDYNDPVVLAKDLEEAASALDVQAQSCRGGALSGVPYPEQLYTRAAVLMRFAATNLTVNAATKETPIESGRRKSS